MDESKFKKIKSWYKRKIENQPNSNNPDLNIDLIINQTFYLYTLGLMPNFFDEMDKINFDTNLISYIGIAQNKKK